MRHPASTTYFHQSAMAISLQDSEKLDYSRTTEQKQTDLITHLSRIASEIFNNYYITTFLHYIFLNIGHCYFYLGSIFFN